MTKNCIHSYLKDINTSLMSFVMPKFKSKFGSYNPTSKTKDQSTFYGRSSDPCTWSLVPWLSLKSKAYRNNIMLSCVSAGRYLSCWYETRSYHNWLLFELWGLRERESSPVRLGRCDGRLSDAPVTVTDSPPASPGPPLPQRLAIKKLKESGWRLEL